MSQTTDTNAKPSKELEIFRKWGGRATTNIAFKEWVMCTINVNKNKSVDELILMIKQGEVEFTHSQNHLISIVVTRFLSIFFITIFR